MSSKVVFKFKSQRDANEVKFRGNYITLGDLIKKIVEMKGLSKSQADFDLVISNDQTKKVYKGEGTKIPKNTRVIVQRVATTYGLLAKRRGGGAASKDPKAAAAAEPEVDEFGGDVFTEDVADDPTLKLAEIAQRQSQINKHNLKNDRRQQGAGRGAQVFQSRKQVFQERTKRPNVGIPKNYLGEGAEGESSENPLAAGDKTDDAATAGAAKFQSDANFEQRVKERGGVSARLTDDEVRKRIDVKDVPPHLLCPLTHHLLKDAVNLPCCAKVCNNEDLERALVNSQFVCPLCQTPEIILDKLTPNRQLRKEVSEFLEKMQTKLEQNASLAVERAAVIADKEREEKLMQNKSYNRPDAVLDFSRKKADATSEKVDGDVSTDIANVDNEQPVDNTGPEEDEDKSPSRPAQASSGWAQVAANTKKKEWEPTNHFSPVFDEGHRDPDPAPPRDHRDNGRDDGYDDRYRYDDRGPPPPYRGDPRDRPPPPGYRGRGGGGYRYNDYDDPYYDRGGYDRYDRRGPPPPRYDRGGYGRDYGRRDRSPPRRRDYSPSRPPPGEDGPPNPAGAEGDNIRLASGRVLGGAPPLPGGPRGRNDNEPNFRNDRRGGRENGRHRGGNKRRRRGGGGGGGRR
mmetsp:Transcript_6139/g.9593  ORF Transcript_6139/g.9593 Transcript_6139/m.9593 type:complete len:627 (-) Transcript_6139:752-2632(-)